MSTPKHRNRTAPTTHHPRLDALLLALVAALVAAGGVALTAALMAAQYVIAAALAGGITTTAWLLLRRHAITAALSRRRRADADMTALADSLTRHRDELRPLPHLAEWTTELLPTVPVDVEGPHFLVARAARGQR